MHLRWLLSQYMLVRMRLTVGRKLVTLPEWLAQVWQLWFVLGILQSPHRQVFLGQFRDSYALAWCRSLKQILSEPKLKKATKQVLSRQPCEHFAY